MDVMTDTQTTVGVVAESEADERRVALVPKAVGPLLKTGIAVVVEAGAGERALLPDELYTEAGATIGDAWAADVVVKVAPPTADEVSRLRSGQTLIGFLAPRNAENSIAALKQVGVQAFALEASSFRKCASCGWFAASRVHEAGFPQDFTRVSAIHATGFASSSAGPKFQPEANFAPSSCSFSASRR